MKDLTHFIADVRNSLSNCLKKKKKIENVKLFFYNSIKEISIFW